MIMNKHMIFHYKYNMPFLLTRSELAGAVRLPAEGGPHQTGRPAVLRGRPVQSQERSVHMEHVPSVNWVAYVTRASPGMGIFRE